MPNKKTSLQPIRRNRARKVIGSERADFHPRPAHESAESRGRLQTIADAISSAANGERDDISELKVRFLEQYRSYITKKLTASDVVDFIDCAMDVFESCGVLQFDWDPGATTPSLAEVISEQLADREVSSCFIEKMEQLGWHQVGPNQWKKKRKLRKSAAERMANDIAIHIPNGDSDD